jgi:hypothetical protein
MKIPNIKFLTLTTALAVLIGGPCYSSVNAISLRNVATITPSELAEIESETEA